MAKKPGTKGPCKWYPVCPMRVFFEQGILDRQWIERYCLGDHDACIRFQKEESCEPHPDNMLPDGFIDERLPRWA